MWGLVTQQQKTTIVSIYLCRQSWALMKFYGFLYVGLEYLSFHLFLETLRIFNLKYPLKNEYN